MSFLCMGSIGERKAQGNDMKKVAKSHLFGFQLARTANEQLAGAQLLHTL